MKNATHLVIDGKVKCHQTSYYPLTTTTDKTKVTCQYCIQGPKLKRKNENEKVRINETTEDV